MSSTYRFHQPAPRAPMGALPDGDYQFIVSVCGGSPYEKNDHLILALKLSIEPTGTPVFCNPWSGLTKDGEERDGIGEFLISCNRAPRDGEEPDWSSIEGARGKCRLKQEEAKMGALAGKMVNKVAWFYAPKQIGPTAEKKQQPQSFSKNQFDQARQAAARNAGLDQEPQDIPF